MTSLQYRAIDRAENILRWMNGDLARRVLHFKPEDFAMARISAAYMNKQGLVTVIDESALTMSVQWRKGK